MSMAKSSHCLAGPRAAHRPAHEPAHRPAHEPTPPCPCRHPGAHPRRPPDPYDGRMAEPRWLSAEEMRAWQAFLAAGALLDRRLDQQLRQESGLSHAQYEILVRL